MDGSTSRAERAADVEWLEGQPFMASIREALLAMGEGASTQHFGRRIRSLQRDGNHWCLSEEGSDWQLRASRLVLSGSLLAHPRFAIAKFCSCQLPPATASLLAPP